MADRTGFNKGATTIHLDRGDYLQFEVTPQGAAANFSQADSSRQKAVDDGNFPGHDTCVWRLLFTRTDAGAQVTAASEQNVQIPPYQRVIPLHGAAVYTVAFGFITADAYTHTVRQCAQDGSLILQIVNVQYKNGKAADSETEPISVDIDA